jgi:hypothetical protein
MQDYSQMRSKTLPKGPPHGWWKRATGGADNVLYPGNKVYPGQLFCGTDSDCLDFRMKYQVVGDGVQ